MRTLLLLVILSVPFVIGSGEHALSAHEATTATQEETPITHIVEPGDTWSALSRRFGVSVDGLQAAAGHMNTYRQPAIGTTFSLTVMQPETTGAITRTANGGLLETAVLNGSNTWQLALANGLQSPYAPGLWRPLFVFGEQTLRELPVGAQAMELTPQIPVPGQALAAHLTLSQDAATTYIALEGEGLAMTQQRQNVVAVGGTGAFSEPGQAELSVQIGDAPVWRQPWSVAERDWVYQQLTLTGDAAEIDQTAILAERERLSALWWKVTPNAQWTSSFQLPIGDYLEISADYGARRSYNGGPYNRYHEGVDFSAYGGTPIYAPAAGTVVLAEPLFVRGGAVLVDHGLGIYTGYYHLSDILVTAGQQVTTGDVLGAVGTTGLSTGNHLHWDLIVNGTWVDAMSWLETDTACWLLSALGQSCTMTASP